MSSKSDLIFSPQFCQKFIVTFKGSIQKVSLYNLTVIHCSKNKTYSFFFRYNSLLAIHNSCKGKPNYPQKADFPPKACCLFISHINREGLFQVFFDAFLLNRVSESGIAGADPQLRNFGDGIGNISQFLEIFELRSDYPVDLSFLPLSKENPFKMLPEEPQKHNVADLDGDLSVSEVLPLELFKNVSKKLELVLEDKVFSFFEMKRLGGGGYGDVYLYLLDGIENESHMFAIKFIEFNTKDERLRLLKMKSILSEAIILTKLDHPNIVKGYFYHKTKRSGLESFCNFMEYCNSGTLFDFLLERKVQNLHLSEKEIIEIFVQILKGIQYTRIFYKLKAEKLKEKPELLVHRDLKPENIFFHVNEQRQRIIKIGDFGLAKTFIQETKPDHSLGATKDYQPPEMSKGGSASEKSDIWSLGVILYNLCFFDFPWPSGTTNYETLKNQKHLLKGNKDLLFDSKGRGISKKMQKLINELLRFEQNDRMSADRLFEHEFFVQELRKDAENLSKRTHKKQGTKIQMLSDDPLKRKMFGESKNAKVKSAHGESVKNAIDQRFCEYLEGVRKEKKPKKLNRIIEEEEEKKQPNDSQSLFSDSRTKRNASSNISRFTSESIKLEFKKVDSKLIFLDYFDEKLANFIEHIPEVAIKAKKAIRLMIQKIKLAILLKVLYDIEVLPENGGIWPAKPELMSFLSENRETHQNFLISLNDQTEKFKVLQEEVFEEVKTEGSGIYLDRRIEVDQILGLLNPQIKSEEFLSFFKSLVEPFLQRLRTFIKEKIKGRDQSKWSEQYKNDCLAIVTLYKGFIALGSLEKHCNDMKGEDLKGFGPKVLKKNESCGVMRLIENLEI